MNENKQKESRDWPIWLFWSNRNSFIIPQSTKKFLLINAPCFSKFWMPESALFHLSLEVWDPRSAKVQGILKITDKQNYCVLNWRLWAQLIWTRIFTLSKTLLKEQHFLGSPIVDVIKLFCRNSRTSRFRPKLKHGNNFNGNKQLKISLFLIFVQVQELEHTFLISKFWGNLYFFQKVLKHQVPVLWLREVTQNRKVGILNTYFSH